MLFEAYLDILGSNRLHHNILEAVCAAIKRIVAFERNSDGFETLCDGSACHCYIMGLLNFGRIILLAHL